MEQSKKYYTPEIEEFFMGFEFQMIGNCFPPESEKSKLDWGDTKIQSGDMLWSIQKLIEHRYIRVKYLDQQDIEECGWEKYGANFRKTGHILLFNQDKSVMIFDGLISIFSGRIKNKSQLLRLMKQLGI